MQTLPSRSRWTKRIASSVGSIPIMLPLSISAGRRHPQMTHPASNGSPAQWLSAPIALRKSSTVAALASWSTWHCRSAGSRCSRMESPDWGWVARRLQLGHSCAWQEPQAKPCGAGYTRATECPCRNGYAPRVQRRGTAELCAMFFNRAHRAPDSSWIRWRSIVGERNEVRLARDTAIGAACRP